MNKTSTEPPPRELTSGERLGIRKLVLEECANYDGNYQVCVLYDDRCFMLDKWWTNCLCRYFTRAVLPLRPSLERALVDTKEQWKPCYVCGKPFAPVGKQIYCSKECRVKGERSKDTEWKRKYRQKRGSDVRK